jgi:hypothetical protein
LDTERKQISVPDLFRLFRQFAKVIEYRQISTRQPVSLSRCQSTNKFGRALSRNRPACRDFPTYP